MLACLFPGTIGDAGSGCIFMHCCLVGPHRSESCTLLPAHCRATERRVREFMDVSLLGVELQPTPVATRILFALPCCSFHCQTIHEDEVGVAPSRVAVPTIVVTLPFQAVALPMLLVLITPAVRLSQCLLQQDRHCPCC